MHQGYCDLRIMCERKVISNLASYATFKSALYRLYIGSLTSVRSHKSAVATCTSGDRCAIQIYIETFHARRESSRVFPARERKKRNRRISQRGSSSAWRAFYRSRSISPNAKQNARTRASSPCDSPSSDYLAQTHIKVLAKRNYFQTAYSQRVCNFR